MPPGVGYGPGTTDDSDPLNEDKQPVPINQPLQPYGQQAELSRLVAATAPPPPTSAPLVEPMGVPATPGTYGGAPSAGTPGIPDALLAPTQRPDVDVATPGSSPTFMPNPVDEFAPPPEATMALLTQLAQSPEVTAQTRAWARLVLRTLGTGKNV